MPAFSVVRQHNGRTTPGVEDVITLVGDPSGYSHVDVTNRDGAGILLVTSDGDTPAADDVDTLTVAAEAGAEGTLGIPDGQTTAEIRVLSTGSVAYTVSTVDVRSWPGRPRALYPSRHLLVPEWDDLRVPMTATQGGGVKDPDLAEFRDDGAGSTGVYSFAFDKTSEEELFFAAELPHGYKEGTDLLPHVHWGTDLATAVGTVIWGLEYTVSNPISGTFGTTDTLEATYTFGGDIQFDHEILSLGTIDGTALKISAMLLCRVYRKATADTFDGDAFLHELDFHYRADTAGSVLTFDK